MTERLLRLMGPPKLNIVQDDGREDVQHLPRASLTLLTLVALQGAGGMARTVVAETLWPEVAPDKAGSRLSSALWRMHSADGTALLAGDNGQIMIAPEARITVDVLELSERTALLRRKNVADWQQSEVAALEASLSRRSGGFLDGLEGDWVTAAQQRCANIYEAALDALIRYHRHHGHVDRSITVARQLVRHDPYREDMQAILVELYGRKGQPGRAVSQYTSARDLLHHDLGVAPGDALIRSLTTVLDRPPPGVDTRADQREVLERLRHLDSNLSRLTRQITEIHSILTSSGHRSVK